MDSVRRDPAVFGDPTLVHDLEQHFAGSRLDIASIVLAPQPADPFVDWVVAPNSAVIAYLRERDGDPGATTRPLAVLLVCPAPGTEPELAARAATIEALRGIVQSITREKTTAWAPVNAIAVAPADLNSAHAVMEFLATLDSAFTAGSTFDLISEHRSTR